jgi:hypothetical protein
MMSIVKIGNNNPVPGPSGLQTRASSTYARGFALTLSG